MAKKTGIPTLSNVARELCRYLNKFAPGLIIKYADNDALLAAIAAAQAACSVLHLEAEKVREYETYV